MYAHKNQKLATNQQHDFVRYNMRRRRLKTQAKHAKS